MLTEKEIDTIMNQITYLKKLAAAYEKEVEKKLDIVMEYLRIAEFRIYLEEEKGREN